MDIRYVETPNKYGRGAGNEPFLLVLHTTLGSYAGAVDWLTTTPEERERVTGRKSYSSAHTVFGRLESEVTELAGVEWATWHAGVVSKPSDRAKQVLKKNLWGGIINPNRYTIGLEFASGYDIDRDGVLESWEKLYTPAQIKNAAKYIIERVEPEIKRVYGREIRFDGSNTLTHKDITSHKPDLEIQRAMVLSELKKQREPAPPVSDPAPPVVDREAKKNEIIRLVRQL